MRSASVFSPRSARKLSKGPRIAPAEFCRKPSFSASSSSFTTSAPPTMSEWPFRYLVTECMTTSAPCSSGRWAQGVAKVLSTTIRMPRARVTSATASRSTSLSMGLVGVSTQTIRVSGRSAPVSSSGSDRSA